MFEYEIEGMVGRVYYEKYWNEAYKILSKHQKIVIETTSIKESYLGPKESFEIKK